MPVSRVAATISRVSSASETATAVPFVSRSAANTKKSPSAEGTRSPLATVFAFATGSAAVSPFSKARTIGAHPSAWTTTNRGVRPGCNPNSCSSSSALRIPTIPVPPPSDR